MNFIVENRKLSFICGMDILNHSYVSLDDELSNCWQRFSKSSDFISTVYKSLVCHICKTFDLMNCSIRILPNLYMYVNNSFWCRFGITRYGFDLYDVTGELVESIYCLDVDTQSIAW